MVDMTRVWERLYLGDRNNAERLYRLNPNGITTVVSLCEEKLVRSNPGINYLHIPIADSTPISVGPFGLPSWRQRGCM